MHGGDIYSEGVLKGKEIIDFSSNINPLGISQSFKNNIQEAYDNMIRYPDIQYRQLKENLKKYIGIKEDYFILGNGAAEIIDIVISCFKSILIIVPSFSEYEVSSNKYGLEIKFSYRRDDMNFEIDYEDILCKLVDGVDCLILGNPNNPNGRVIDKDRLIPILKECEKKGTTVIIDEAFIEFAGNEDLSFVKFIKQYNCIFIIRAITKFFGLPGVRFGYGITANKILADNIKKRQLPWNINCFAEIAVKYCMFDSEYIKNTIFFIQEEKKYLIQNLKKIKFIGCIYESDANFLLLKLRYINSTTLYNMCKDKGVLIRTCNDYKGLDDKFIRIAVKDRKNNDIFLHTLRCIQEN